MSKYYDQYRRPTPKERPWRIRPVWRGIGCVMLVVIPLVSFAIADVLVKENLQQGWLPIPYDLTGPSAYPYLYAKLGVTLLISVGIFALYTILYMFIYQLLGPPKYGPKDSPPLKRKASMGRRRKR